jgi:hypothetical protein
VRHAEVVDHQQVAVLPRLADGDAAVDLVYRLDGLGGHRRAGAVRGVERESGGTVDVDQVAADLRIKGQPVEEGDLVEPADGAITRVAQRGGPPLPGDQAAVRQPLVLQSGRLAVGVDLGGLPGAEPLAPGHADLVVHPLEEPAVPREAVHQPGRQGPEHRLRVRDLGFAALQRGGQAAEEQERRYLVGITQLVVHAHRLVGGPLRTRVDALGVRLPRGEPLSFGHPPHAQGVGDGGHILGGRQAEPAYHDGPALVDQAPDLRAAFGSLGRRAAGSDVDRQDR